jgi:hypothetical protein
MPRQQRSAQSSGQGCARALHAGLVGLAVFAAGPLAYAQATYALLGVL